MDKIYKFIEDHPTLCLIVIGVLAVSVITLLIIVASKKDPIFDSPKLEDHQEEFVSNYRDDKKEEIDEKLDLTQAERNLTYEEQKLIDDYYKSNPNFDSII